MASMSKLQAFFAPIWLGHVQASQPAGIVLVLGAAPDHQVDLAALDAGGVQRLAGGGQPHEGRGLARAGDGLALHAELQGDDVLRDARGGGEVRSGHPTGGEPGAKPSDADMHGSLHKK